MTVLDANRIIYDEIINEFLAITNKTLENSNPITLNNVSPMGKTGDYDRLRIALEKRYSIQMPVLDCDTNDRSKIYIRDLVEYILISKATAQEKPQDDDDAGEHNGGDVNYYVAEITDPKRFDAYTAEAEDIIEALDMSFSEGTAFKSIWRKAAERTLGKIKQGSDALYNAQKVYYYGGRMVAIEEKKLKDE